MATTRSGKRAEATLREAACWVRVALRRWLESAWRRGALATDALPSVSTLGEDPGKAEPALPVATAEDWPATLAVEGTGVSSGTCWRTMNKAMAATEAASAPPQVRRKKTL